MLFQLSVIFLLYHRQIIKITEEKRHSIIGSHKLLNIDLIFKEIY